MIFTCQTRRFVATTSRGNLSQQFVASCVSALTMWELSDCVGLPHKIALGALILFNIDYWENYLKLQHKMFTCRLHDNNYLKTADLPSCLYALALTELGALGVSMIVSYISWAKSHLFCISNRWPRWKRTEINNHKNIMRYNLNELWVTKLYPIFTQVTIPVSDLYVKGYCCSTK